MASGNEELRARIEAGLSRAAGQPVQVRSATPLAGGACQELFGLELPGNERVVLRSDAPRPLPGSIDRRAEHAVASAAAAAGVCTPAPRWLAPDLVREGAWAYCLPWVEGEALGAKVVKDPALEGARKELPAQLARELARIHALTPGLRPELVSALGPPPADAARAALGALRELIATLPGRDPAFELLLRWLDAHAPAPGPLVLVHGDFRVGNFLVGPEGLRAVLDWEFAHWGSPAEDLAWIALRDWRFGRLDRPVGGLCDRAPFHQAYAAAAGRTVDPAEVRWWEVCGNLRWAAGSLCQGERYLSGAQPDLELLAVGRRAPEILWEALRLAGGCARPPVQPRVVIAPAGPGGSPLDRPGAAALLEGLARFLEVDLRPALPADRRLGYRALVAVSLCRSLANELGQAEVRTLAEEQALERLRRLVGVVELTEGEIGATLPELERVLVDYLGSGRRDAAPGGPAWQHVSARLAARLAAINPRFDLSEGLP